jgi:hypothetical protein
VETSSAAATVAHDVPLAEAAFGTRVLDELEAYYERSLVESADIASIDTQDLPRQ